METKIVHEEIGEIFSKLAVSENLTQQEAQVVASKIFTALSNEEQNSLALLAAFFGALTIKKPSIDELIGTAKAMEKTKTVNFHFKTNNPVVTAGGTGGDTLHTINITTPAIITAASAGAYAVKSGSKSFSSKTGCIDVAEALGVNVHLTPNIVEECVEKIGTVIWASEGIYPWMHSLIKLGSEPSTKQLLPLLYSLRLVIATALNPFSLKRQVRGVSEPFTEIITKVLGACGYERAFVVLGYGETEKIKIDEFSTLGRNVVSELKTNGDVETFDVHPEEVGIK
jgi:anthranilate phosphoribosyltransferase